MTKDLSYYLRLPYTIVLRPDPDGGYVASIAELPGCLSQGETLQEAVEMIEDAKSSWISAALDDGYPIPEPNKDDEEYSGRLNVRMPKSLHRMLAEQAKAEGTSLNQIILYHLSRGIGPIAATVDVIP